MRALLAAGSAVMEAAWETRRRLYARGLLKPHRVAARVVSIGNLTVGGTGKTTLTLHLAQRARERGVPFRVVCRRYRPGPAGRGDEERLYQNALGEAVVLAGRSKLALARQAAATAAQLVLVDDGFSHWPLERDLDIVLVNAADPWGGGRLLPAGRLREPRRALQRADVVLVTQLPAPEWNQPGPIANDIHRAAPAAVLAGARYEVTGFRDLAGRPRPRPVQAHLVTATGDPEGVSRTARVSGAVITGRSIFRDHHWFTPAEVAEARRLAAASGGVVMLTAKDAVRWPDDSHGEVVIEIAWRWAWGGDEVERRVFGDAR